MCLHTLDRAGDEDRRVVDNDVELAEAFGRHLHAVRDAVQIAQVEDHRDRLAAGNGDLLDHGVNRPRQAGVLLHLGVGGYGHLRARPREVLGDVGADAPAGAGYERDTSLERHGPALDCWLSRGRFRAEG